MKKLQPSTPTVAANNNNGNIPVQIRCVLFANEPNIREIPSRSEFSAEEVDNSWYCRLEMEAMTAMALDPANERNMEGGGSRGLEQYTTAGSTRLEVHRVQVVAAVLREQRRQKKDNNNNNNKSNNGEDKIATAASIISQECQDLAYMQGYNDEIEAYAGASSIATDVVVLPKPGFFSGFTKQVIAIKDMAFLEHEAKQKKQSKISASNNNNNKNSRR